MDVFHGLAPNVDDNHIIDNISFMQNVVAKTSDYTILPSESGTVFTTAGASKDLEFTLPAVSGLDGFVCWVFNAEDFECLVTAPDETLVAFHDATADGISFTTTSNQVGGGFMFVCDGVLWYACCFRGDAGATITVASA
jgi:hypothetical protein